MGYDVNNVMLKKQIHVIFHRNKKKGRKFELIHEVLIKWSSEINSKALFDFRVDRLCK